MNELLASKDGTFILSMDTLSLMDKQQSQLEVKELLFASRNIHFQRKMNSLVEFVKGDALHRPLVFEEFIDKLNLPALSLFPVVEFQVQRPQVEHDVLFERCYFVEEFLQKLNSMRNFHLFTHGEAVYIQVYSFWLSLQGI